MRAAVQNGQCHASVPGHAGVSASAGTPEPGRIHSIRQRLLNHARANGEEFQFVLDRFAVEALGCL